MLQTATNWFIARPAALLNIPRDIFMLSLRIHVGWQFFKAGWLKINSWSNTISQFQNDFQVPILPPVPAAVLGTFAELFFPALLFIGLSSRLASVGLQAVNVVAMMSVVHYFSDGLGYADPAFADHYLWGLMLLAVAFYGPGRLSVDYLLSRRQDGRI